MESFNQLLNNYVRQAGISDTELARALGVSRQTIFRWREGLTGRPRQREDVLVIARKLRLTPEERDKLLLAAGFRPEGEGQESSPSTSSGTGAGEQGSEEARTRGEEIPQVESTVFPPHAPSPPLSSQWPIWIMGGLVLLVLAVWWMNGQPTDPPATATPLITVAASSPLRLLVSASPAPAQPGETVILITHFANYASSQVGYNVAGRLAQALQQEIDQADQANNLRIVIWPEPVGERAEALQAGQTVSATLVIFGEYDVGRIVVEFAQPADQTNFADPAVQRHVADVPDLSATINGDLPQQVRSLALIALGQIYLTRGQAKQAQPLLLQARDDLRTDHEVDPQTWALVNFYLGLAYHHSQPPHLDEAIAAYGQAVDTWPEMISSRLNRSAAYASRAKSSDLELALADADQIIAAKPDWAAAYINRSSIRWTIGGAENLSLALADLDKALALDTHLPEAYYNRAYIRLQQGVSMETVGPDLTEAVALRPNYANALNLLCWGYAVEQQPELALPYCQQAIAADPQPLFFDSRGLVYALQGDYPAAVADFKHYTDWLAKQPAGQQAPLARRRAWIKSLEAGQNPFTPQLLAELRAQFGQ